MLSCLFPELRDTVWAGRGAVGHVHETAESGRLRLGARAFSSESGRSTGGVLLPAHRSWYADRHRAGKRELLGHQNFRS